MNKVITIVISILLFIFLAVSVMYFMRMGPFAPKFTPKEVNEKAKIGKEMSEPELLIELPTFVIAIVDDDRNLVKQVQLVFSFKLVDKEAEQKLKEYIPRMIDKYLLSFYGILPLYYKSHENIEVSYLRLLLKSILDKTEYKDDVSEILIQNILEEDAE